MKKLLNKKFFLMLGSSIVFLIILAVAMIFLTKENTKSFSKSGYIIASGKEAKSTKYYFDEGTTYKLNVNSEIVFKDTSGEKVNVETDNFMHYLDGGMKFLKNGVIMDLESINNTVVPYYNITNKSILEYSNKSYVIEAVDKTLAFNNLVGRISENKYIFAGVSIKLQLAGNDKIIEGDYFEIQYIKDGIIKVENQEVEYQTTAENSFVLVNDNIKIDLGTKMISYDGVDKVSLSQMTIDGNENIEIISKDIEDPKNNDDKDNKNNNDNQDDPNNNQGNQGNTGEPTNPDNSNQGNTDEPTNPDEPINPDDGNGDNDNQGTTRERSATIDLVKAEVGVNNLSATFIINDPYKSIKGNLILRVTNSETGKVEYSIELDKSQSEVIVGTQNLSPNSNYVLSIFEEGNSEYDTQYFQKLFKTESLGISLEKKYITQDSLAYDVVFEEKSRVKSVKVYLYDANMEQLSDPISITRDNNTALFENLTSNTSYNVVLSDVILDNLEYNSRYQMTKTTKTLKKVPYLSDLSVSLNDDKTAFIVGIDNVIDTDNSIVKYRYEFYEANKITKDTIDTLEPAYVEIKTDKNKFSVGISKDKLQAKKNYRYKVIAEYYDNEKYGEFETGLSDNFILTSVPSVEFTQDLENTTLNTIVGKLKLIDESCTVPLAGRLCSAYPSYKNNIYLEYNAINSGTSSQYINLTLNPNDLETDIKIESLLANTTYEFKLWADVDLQDGNGIISGYQIAPTFTARTASAETLRVNWPSADDKTKVESTRSDPIRIKDIRITSSNDLMANSMHNMTFELYANNSCANSILEGAEPIKTVTVSGELKDTYYNRTFMINTYDTFGIKSEQVTEEIEEPVYDEEGNVIDTIIKTNTYTKMPLEVLKSYTGGQLQKCYLVQITNVTDNTGNEIPIQNNLYNFKMSSLFLLEDKELNPTITAEPIQNQQLKYDSPDLKIYEKEYDKKLSDTTLVGYKVLLNVQLEKINEQFKGFSPLKELIYYVCDGDKNPDCTIEDAVETKVIDLTVAGSQDDLSYVFYLDNGTKFQVADKNLTRGHNYIFKAKLNLDTDGEDGADTLYPSTDVRTNLMKTPKQAPDYSVYIKSTTDSKITYEYKFNDIDNALYEEKFYYIIETGNEEEEPEEQVVDFNNGNFEIEGLTNDSVYSISFKQALIKNKRGVESVEVGKYIFDGKYAYDGNTITFKNVTYDNDNRLRITILENELNQKYVDRVSAYHVILSTPGEESYERVYQSDQISSCTEGETEYKCIIIDYADIKNFKTKDVTVKVIAYYDTGIINNDFPSLAESTTGYILQNNNYYNEEYKKAKYIYFRAPSGVTTSDYPAGIFEYSSLSPSLRTKLNIFRKNNPTTFTFITDKKATDVLNNGDNNKLIYERDGIKYKDSSGNYQTINNKLLNTVELNATNNKFKFNSIIPKIKVSSTGLVNGAKVTITPVGVDEETLQNEFKLEDDGKYYFYLEIYERLKEIDPETGELKETGELNLYKKDKVEINLTGSVIELTKYMPNTTYSFKVFANMKKENDYKMTELFDANKSSQYGTTEYKFSSLAPNLITRSFHKKEVTYTSVSDTESGIYSKRELELFAATTKNIGEYDTRFELYDVNGELVLSKVVTPDTVSHPSYSKSTAKEDITGTTFVFGPDYYTMKIYIETEVFDSTEKADLLIYDEPVVITRLKDPTITVTPTSDVNSLSYKININDPDRVITDGKYCVELLTSTGASIPGKDRICNLSALEINKTITFDNLTSDTVYMFRVFADIYTNNYLEENKSREIENKTILSTSTSYGVALGSVALTGSKTSVTLTFRSGVNIMNIKKIDYTITEYGGKKIASETYTMGVNKNFIKEGDTIKLVISPDILNQTNLVSGVEYFISAGFWVEQGGQLVKLNNKNYDYSFKF